jgi:hypothetical protein
MSRTAKIDTTHPGCSRLRVYIPDQVYNYIRSKAASNHGVAGVITELVNFHRERSTLNEKLDRVESAVTAIKNTVCPIG